MPVPPELPESLRRMLYRRDTVAAFAAAAAAHDIEDSELLESAQRDLEEQLELLLPLRVWQNLFPTWRMTDMLLAHDPATQRPTRSCHLCAAASAQRRLLPLAESA